VPRKGHIGERRWPMATAVLLTGVMRIALPAQVRLDDARPVFLVVLAGLVVALIVGDPGRIDRQKTWLRVVTVILIGLITAVNGASAVRLVIAIITSEPFTEDARVLFLSGSVIWLTNVIAFGLWFWDLDRGGAAARADQTPNQRSCSRRCRTPNFPPRAGPRPSLTTCTFPSMARWRSARRIPRRSRRGPN
jgi:hypothetical protein